MLAAAVVPHPPLLVPALAAGAAAEVATVLAACDAAISSLLAEAPEVIVCVGAGRTSTRHRPGAWGTLSGFGADVPVPGHHHVGRAHLPLSLTMGRWLLDRAGWDGRTINQELDPQASPTDCRTIGQRLRGEVTGRACWLVLGDGSTIRGQGSLDPAGEREAAGSDELVTGLLATGDVAGIAALDAAASPLVQAGGRPAWQVLAGAVAAGSQVSRTSVGFAGAPFGVGYTVANWWLTAS